MLSSSLSLLCFIPCSPVFAYLVDNRGHPLDPCSPDPWWTQPVAIEIGLNTLTAAYAHTPTNTTILANLDPRDPASNLTDYAELIHALYEQYLEEYYAPPEEEYPSWLPSSLEPIWYHYRVNLYWSAQYKWYSFQHSIADLRTSIEEFTSIFLAPLRAAVKAASGWYYYFLPQQRLLIGSYAGPPTPDIENAFAQAFLAVKTAALRNGVNITHPFIIYPDFFDVSDHCRARVLLEQAASRAGFSYDPWSPLTHRQLLGQYSGAMLFNQSSIPISGCVPRRDQSSLLVLNQGVVSFDLITTGKHGSMSRPVEDMGCDRILKNLAWRIGNRAAFLGEEIERGASSVELARQIMRVRELFKDAKSVNETSCLGDEGLEEWPLDLSHWWVDEPRGEVMLPWRVIEAVDEEYVETLVDRLDDALLEWQGTRGYTSEPASAKSIDGVVITGAYCDGSLLARAARQSIGEHVKLFGSSEGVDTAFLARLGAGVALRLREERARKMEEDCRAIEKDGYHGCLRHERGILDEDDEWEYEHSEL